MEEAFEKLFYKINKLLENDCSKQVLELATLEPHLAAFSKVVNSISKLSNDYKLNFAWKCIAEGLNEEESKNILYNYVSNVDRAFYISDSFKKIILSNSKIASTVMAYIIGEIVKAQRDYMQEDVILYEALSHMTDFDIRNFVSIMDDYIGVEKIGDEFVDIWNIPQDKKSGYILTLKLCVNSRIFELKTEVEYEAYLNSGEFYKKTDMAVKLRGYIEKIKPVINYQ